MADKNMYYGSYDNPKKDLVVGRQIRSMLRPLKMVAR